MNDQPASWVTEKGKNKGVRMQLRLSFFVVAISSVFSQAQNSLESLSVEHTKIQLVSTADKSELETHKNLVNINSTKALEFLENWKGLFFGIADWPQDKYMKADKNTKNLVMQVMAFKKSVKSRDASQLTNEEIVRLYHLTKKVMVFEEETPSLPTCPIDSAWLRRGWSEVLYTDTLLESTKTLESVRVQADAAFTGQQWDSALTLYRSLKPTEVSIKVKLVEVVNEEGIPTEITNGRSSSSSASIEQVVRDLGIYLYRRDRIIQEAYRTRFAALETRDMDRERFAKLSTSDELLNQLGKLELCEQIRKDPVRLALTTIPVTALVAQMRSDLSATISMIPVTKWIRPESSTIPALDSPAHCDKAGELLAAQIPPALSHLEQGKSINGLTPEILNTAESLALIDANRRRELEENYNSLKIARVFVYESEAAIKLIPKRKAALLAEEAKQVAIRRGGDFPGVIGFRRYKEDGTFDERNYTVLSGNNIEIIVTVLNTSRVRFQDKAGNIADCDMITVKQEDKAGNLMERMEIVVAEEKAYNKFQNGKKYLLISDTTGRDMDFFKEPKHNSSINLTVWKHYRGASQWITGGTPILWLQRTNGKKEYNLQ